MHIAINCRSISKKHCTGIGRYTGNLIRSLARIDGENTYALYTSRGWGRLRRLARELPGNFSLRMDWFNRGVDKTFPSMEVYHAPSPQMLETRCEKIVVTVHDLIYKTFPQSHTPETIALTERQFQSFLPRALKIICSSRSTLNDLRAYFPVAEARTCFIHQGVDRDIFYLLSGAQKDSARAALQKKGITAPFILFAGTIEPRKNLHGLLEAFGRLKTKRLFAGTLVAAGMIGWKNEGLEPLLERLGIKGDVIFPGFVSNEELRALYNLAEVFVFPSFYEGFGYPIVEAFSCGAAVVASRTSSCGELAGDAALLVEPSDIEGIAEAAARIIQDAGLRENLRQKALARAGEFDNLKTARETLKIYEEVYNG